MDAWQEIEELRQQLARLAMVGRVSDVNEAKRQVRVIWPASGETSGWLFVLQRGEVWLPKINELVLVLYLPVFGGDGFVLGSVGGLG
jgi:phage baseplate assembly protein gpV